MEVSPFLSVTFAAGAFTEDTAVTAKLDVAAGKLVLSSRGGELKPQRTQINLDLTKLPKGLQIEHLHRADPGDRFVGVLTEVAEKPRPQLVALTENGLEPVTVDQSTIVLLGENGKRAQQEKWANLAYGDVVRIRYVGGRRADLIEASRKTGEVAVDHVTENRIAVAGGGRPLVVNAKARLEDADGKPLQLASLAPDDKISYRQHPDTEEVWYVKRTLSAAQAGPTLVLNHDANKPLLPGDRVRLRASGTRGGKVTFDVIGVESDLEAKELRELAGTYERIYTVPRGVKVAEARVVARLTLPDGKAATALAEAPLRFAEAGATTQPKPDTKPAEKPATKPADPKPASKPKAPVVTAPKDGDAVADTLVVTGTAAPNQKVKIVIDYVVTKAIFKLGEGRLTEVEVTADAKGVFRSENISTDVRTLIKGDTDYTITVTAVAADGTESEAVVVKVRRPD